MNNDKNLFLIVPSLKLGGSERVAINCANILKDNYNVKIVVFDGSNIAFEVPFELININRPRKKNKLSKIINVIIRSIILKRLKRVYKVNYSISFNPSADLANLLSKGKEVCLPIIHGYGASNFSFYQKKIYRKATKIGCVSKLIAENVSTHNPKLSSKLFVLYNPYDVNLITMKGKEIVNDYKFNKYTIISHGRLDEVKNYQRLVKAFSLVNKQIPEAQLLIIGEGQERTKLEKLIKAYNLKDNVTLLGFRNNPFSYLEKASLYVLSSYSEGFPNSLVEAMMFLPVVAADCKSGPREILSNEAITKVCRGWEETDYGILVEPEEKSGFNEELTQYDYVLAEAILFVLSNPEKARTLKDRAKQRAETFSYQSFYDKLNSIL